MSNSMIIATAITGYLFGLFLIGLILAILAEFDIVDFDDDNTYEEILVFALFWPLSIPVIVLVFIVYSFVFGPYWLAKNKKRKNEK